MKPPAKSATRPARILHLHSTFDLGGKEARATRLMNLMGDRAQHTILSAVPDALGARDAGTTLLMLRLNAAPAPKLMRPSAAPCSAGPRHGARRT